jgi:hypothetical protein
LILKKIRKGEKVKRKGKFHLKTGQEGPEEKYRENTKVSFCSKRSVVEHFIPHTS